MNSGQLLLFLAGDIYDDYLEKDGSNTYLDKEGSSRGFSAFYYYQHPSSLTLYPTIICPFPSQPGALAHLKAGRSQVAKRLTLNRTPAVRFGGEDSSGAPEFSFISIPMSGDCGVFFFLQDFWVKVLEARGIALLRAMFCTYPFTQRYERYDY